MAEEWLTLGECARQAGMGTKALRRAIESGRIPVRAVRVSDRNTRVHRAQWDGWLAARTFNAEVQPSSA